MNVNKKSINTNNKENNKYKKIIKDSIKEDIKSNKNKIKINNINNKIKFDKNNKNNKIRKIRENNKINKISNKSNNKPKSLNIFKREDSYKKFKNINIGIYDESVRKRGELYYLNNKIKFVVKYNNKLYGKVYGGNIYNTVVDLTNYTGYCSCPYKYNCKHAYSILLSYLNDDYIDGNKYIENLQSMDKNEIINILLSIILKNNLWDDVLITEDNLIDRCKSMLKTLLYDKKSIYTFKSFLRNFFLNNASNEELLELLKIIGKNEVDISTESRDYLEIVEMLSSEIINRNDRKLIDAAYSIFKRYRTNLWIFEEYYYDYQKGVV